MSQRFQEFFNKVVTPVHSPGPIFYLMHELLRELVALRFPNPRGLRLPQQALLRKGHEPTDAQVLEIARALAFRADIPSIVLSASKMGGFTGIFFELLWLCEEETQPTRLDLTDPKAQQAFQDAINSLRGPRRSIIVMDEKPAKPALDPARQNETKRARRKELVDDLRAEAKRIEQRKGGAVLLRGRASVVKARHLAELLNIPVSVARLREFADLGRRLHFTDELYRRLEECQ